MNQHSMHLITAAETVEIEKKIIYLSSGGHITPAICILADHTKKMLRLHKLDQIANCMQLANKLFLEGNEAEQKEVASVFFGLFSFLQSHYTKAEWTAIKKYIPDSLFNAYLVELNTSKSVNQKIA